MAAIAGSSLMRPAKSLSAAQPSSLCLSLSPSLTSSSDPFLIFVGGMLPIVPPSQARLSLERMSERLQSHGATSRRRKAALAKQTKRGLARLLGARLGMRFLQNAVLSVFFLGCLMQGLGAERKDETWK
ncbi:hypothetical protein M440DRAFT_1398293 [Trichoderma longibrachiatum ATCC 18648]|uniref:Uncharacterized protein n=1 Tax=Trichoderma longibrachiatum ATCC 18648 TaxID=983965 RepID=A0A2T4CBS7_TRILO|nr:hypothetical protein M440DRAFT_1398293 [Trichoderma longibrachiatum ATCC 18648]